MNNYLNLKIDNKIRYIPTIEEIEYAEQTLQITFPKTYITFVSNYGAGILFDTFNIYAPGKTSEKYDLLVRSKQDIELIIENIDMDIWEYHEVEPSEKWLEGLFPFGSSVYGDLLCWDTHKEMKDQEYPIIILDDEQAFAPKVGENLDEFITEFCLNGEIEKYFPKGKGKKWNLGNTFLPN